MSIAKKYLDALELLNDWTTVSDWAIKFGEIFPELLVKANKEAQEYKTPSTGLREIAARISSNISRGAWAGTIEIDDSERPKKVRLLTKEQAESYVLKEIEDDVAPITRAQRIKSDEEALTTKEKYRILEMEAIISQLKSFFNLDFEFEHAKAMLNPIDPGKHHPDNIQILLKSHNRMKGSSNWERFTLPEQIEYIKAVIQVQKIVSSKMKIDLEEDLVASIIERLKLIY
jgi:hypothetical protein